jgi:membrane glycosyltransferase
VYKEGLRSVIEPTIRSIKNAISTYEMQGGTANIFVNDDGMQLLSDADARERQEFYEEHNIGWVARPKHNPKPTLGEKAFQRRGKFKKASNMNYALWVSQRVEGKLEKFGRPPNWTQDDEALVYQNALSEAIAEDEGRTWAEGNIRMGDYILLIDSDTRVPSDCLLDAVSEMEQSPRVAIMQYSSGVMNVTDSFFERGITFFTNLIYTQIRYAVANGDVAPFVGHNAILRWAAVQEIAYDCPLDSREKYWSEATVSEDFDMALRLQTYGYLVRLAVYTGDGFKEGVSLTVYDELARWEKYAYGCNELIFHPIHQWLTKGPITPLFRNFLFSNMPFPSKITILAYIGTYYALGSSWILTLMNYFVVGWYNGWYDHYYLASFKIFFAIIIVFTALGNISLAALRYRTEERSLFPALVENLKWIPLLIVFLGGVSLHVSQALLCHMCAVDMSWGATSKEAENIGFFEEIPRVVRRFKWTFAVCIVLTAVMVVMATVVPQMWRIDFLVAVFPLAMVVFSHFMLPIALNPNLMLFTW